MSSSEEEEYDSEEEALRARQAQTARAARVRAQAAQERERLRGYHARQRLEEEQGFRFQKESGRAWAQEGQRCDETGPAHAPHRARVPEAGLVAAVAGDGERCAGPGACSPLLQRGVWAAQPLLGGCTSWSGGHGPATTCHDPPARRWDRLYQPPWPRGPADPDLAMEAVGQAHIPWLPCAPAAYLHALALAEPEGAAAGSAAGRVAKGSPLPRDLRRAYARACLWWHPDKFTQRLGHRLDPADREAMLLRVQATFQALSAAWQELGGD